MIVYSEINIDNIYNIYNIYDSNIENNKISYNDFIYKNASGEIFECNIVVEYLVIILTIHLI